MASKISGADNTAQTVQARNMWYICHKLFATHLTELDDAELLQISTLSLLIRLKSFLERSVLVSSVDSSRQVASLARLDTVGPYSKK